MTKHGALHQWILDHVDHAGDECLPWPFGRNKQGYGFATINGKQGVANREMCRLAHGEPPSPDHDAAHTCRGASSGCINPNHLKWKTRKENMADKRADGTHYAGSRHFMAKLTDKDVAAIRAMVPFAYGDIKRVAAQYRVSPVTIRRVVTGRAYA